MGWAKHDPQSEFVPEWCAVGALLLADALLCARAGLHFRLTPGAYWLAPLLVAAAILLRRKSRRIALLLDYFALLIVTDVAVRMVTYAASVFGGPLWDTRLAAADHALGFDWLTWFHFVLNHPQLGGVLALLYYRIGLAAILFLAVMSLAGHAARMRETFWLLFLASLMTAAGAALMPVLGPFHTYNLSAACGPFVLVLEHLRAGQDLNFPLGALQGVIQCPSFHTTLALALIYAFRGTGVLGKTVTILNVMLLFGVPVFGGHYLTDMLAGTAVMLMSLTLVKGFAKLRASAASASPGYAAVSGGAY
jgi:hypothetical protein